MKEDPFDFTSLAVALGRIEEKVSHLDKFDERLRKVETTVERMEDKQPPRAPWWVVAGGIASVLTVVSLGIAVIVYIARSGGM